MKRQRNITQMKEQGKTSQDQINKEEISKLHERLHRGTLVPVKTEQVLSIHQRRAWQPTLIFSPGESNGQRSLVGYSS